MSYDIDIHDEHFNYTYNVSPMFQLAFGEDGINIINKQCGRTASKILKNAINYFIENRVKLEKLNPSNGWGSYDGALSFLRNVMDACNRHTRRRVSVS